ncbi:MAG TPA: hypothetical protein VLX61_11115 [Anaerolineales bacterium]|nr:hypothetical protein [Anaerolineales bacterium]
MKRFWFQLFLWAAILAWSLGFVLVIPAKGVVHAQDISTPTAEVNSQPYITNTYTDTPAINVRAGPSSVYYGNPIGQLLEGATAPALAMTAGHDWVEIAFPSGPNGVGWVYAPFVTLTGVPPVIEPPPTFTPIAISTIDPTLMSTFNVQPTQTHLPTFTPAAPLVVPTFAVSPAEPSAHFPFGVVIISLGIVGLLGIVVSIVGRR